MGVLHLPSHLAAAEKEAPEPVQITRHIEPRQALELIANQQAKLVRLLAFLKNHDDKIEEARARAGKATHVAARLAGENKQLKKVIDVYQDAALRTINELEEQQKFLKAVICRLIYETGDMDWTMTEQEYNEFSECELTIDYPGNGTAKLTYKTAHQLQREVQERQALEQTLAAEALKNAG